MAREPRQLAGIGASDLPDLDAIKNYVGPPREVIVDGKTLRVQDGSSPGGLALARAGDNDDITGLSGLTTPLSQAQGGSGAATLADASVTIPGISAPHILGDFLKNPISLERFGCVGNFNGSTGFDNATAFQAALASGEELRLPIGKRYLVGGTDPITNRSLSIAGRGPGRGSALVFPGSVGNGLRISQNSYDYSTSISNLALLTLGQETGTALSVTYSAADSASARGDVRAALDHLTVSGVDFTQAGWANGIVLTDVHNLTMTHPVIVGRRDATLATRAAFGKMVNAIRYTGSTTGSIPSDALIDNPRIANAQLAILSDGYVEGLRVERPILVGVWGGVRAAYSNIRPWTRVIGGHMNAFDYAVWLTNSPQSRIEQLLLYKIELTRAADPTGGRTFAVLLDGCDFSNVEDLRLMNQAASATANGDFDGVEVKNSNYCRVRNIEHERPSTGMKWSGTSQFGESDRYRSLGTYAGATIAEYVDTTGTGTNVRVDGSLPKGTASNDAAITTTLNNQFAASINITGCEVGQRYRIDIAMTAVAGANDTEIFYYVYNVGGTGNGAFGKNASTLKGRAPVPASKEHDAVISGIYTITQRGSINMGLGVISQRTVNGTATEGPTTIPAGGIQMTATLL